MRGTAEGKGLNPLTLVLCGGLLVFLVLDKLWALAEPLIPTKRAPESAIHPAFGAGW
jgi:hypothetical protein